MKRYIHNHLRLTKIRWLNELGSWIT